MKTILRLFDHLYWANHCMMEVLAEWNGEAEETLRLFHHVLQAERVWLTRLQGKDSSHLKIWGSAEPDALKELIRENEQSYKLYLSALKPDRLDEVIHYNNQSGTEAFQTSVRDILTHVALHGQYHRGQMNKALRQSKLEPASVDYIVFVRNH